MSVIRTVPPETVRAFYKRHYHPERMAVVAVGDFEDGGKGVVRYEYGQRERERERKRRGRNKEHLKLYISWRTCPLTTHRPHPLDAE